MSLASLDELLLDHRVKGMPGGIAPFPLGRIGERKWNVLCEDLPLPLAVLKERALTHNSAWMRRFLDLSGAMIAPHGKTTMSPQLFARQLADGAWAMTVATVQQLQVARDFGIGRIVLANQGFFAPAPIILSAGGSAFYDLVVARFRAAGIDRECLVLTRSGCYLTHDSVLYHAADAELRRRMPGVEELGPGLMPALEVWAYVQSRPEPAKALLTMGKRDVSYDELPVPLHWCRPGMSAPQTIASGHIVTGLNDQHCHMTVPADSPLAVGDMVAFGISHPCLTFDKWQVICVVDDDYTVTGAIKTFF